jgi:hypothetical protein
MIFNVGYNNNSKTSIDNTNDDSDDMDVDVSPISNKSIKSGIERMQMSLRLEKKYQNDEIIAENRRMMEVFNTSLCFLYTLFFILKSFLNLISGSF